jgi:hypothetical protein
MPSEYTWQASVCPRFLPELRLSSESLRRDASERFGALPVHAGLLNVVLNRSLFMSYVETDELLHAGNAFVIANDSGLRWGGLEKGLHGLDLWELV